MTLNESSITTAPTDSGKHVLEASGNGARASHRPTTLCQSQCLFSTHPPNRTVTLNESSITTAPTDSGKHVLEASGNGARAPHRPTTLCQSQCSLPAPTPFRRTQSCVQRKVGKLGTIGSTPLGLTCMQKLRTCGVKERPREERGKQAKGGTNAL